MFVQNSHQRAQKPDAHEEDQAWGRTKKGYFRDCAFWWATLSPQIGERVTQGY